MIKSRDNIIDIRDMTITAGRDSSQVVEKFEAANVFSL